MSGNFPFNKKYTDVCTMNTCQTQTRVFWKNLSIIDLQPLQEKDTFKEQKAFYCYKPYLQIEGEENKKL